MNTQFNFTANQSLNSNAAAPSIEGALNIGCLLKCGSGVLSCIQCGTNLGCWATCAGPQVVSCVSDCF